MCVLVVARSVVASISGLVVEYIVAIDVTRVRFPADACDVPVCVLRFRVSCACPTRSSSTSKNKPKKDTTEKDKTKKSNKNRK